MPVVFQLIISKNHDHTLTGSLLFVHASSFSLFLSPLPLYIVCFTVFKNKWKPKVRAKYRNMDMENKEYSKRLQFLPTRRKSLNNLQLHSVSPAPLQPLAGLWLKIRNIVRSTQNLKGGNSPRSKYISGEDSKLSQNLLYFYLSRQKQRYFSMVLIIFKFNSVMNNMKNRAEPPVIRFSLQVPKIPSIQNMFQNYKHTS